MKYAGFLRALKIPDGDAARQLFDAAQREGLTYTEAKRLFVQTRREDLERQIEDALEQGRRNRDAANRSRLILPKGV